MEVAILAGGCFWCIEAAFMGVYGVVATACGYVGKDESPTYKIVCSGSGHCEAVKVSFDETKITYLQILELFWRQIDPLDPSGQFLDRGKQYQTALFVLDAKQQRLAEESKMHIQSYFSKPIATEILESMPFTLAEQNHQTYCLKEPSHYNAYAGGHKGRLFQLWSDKPPFSQHNIKEYLTALQYKVIFHEGTEPPFDNAYFDNKKEGTYIDIISGDPLFSSETKYDSGTGWPSFYAPINENVLVESEDLSLGQLRIEVKGRKSHAHLGHVFPDGPPPTHRRYCMNSAALHFIPKNND